MLRIAHSIAILGNGLFFTSSMSRVNLLRADAECSTLVFCTSKSSGTVLGGTSAPADLDFLNGISFTPRTLTSTSRSSSDCGVSLTSFGLLPRLRQLKMSTEVDRTIPAGLRGNIEISCSPTCVFGRASCGFHPRAMRSVCSGV